MLLALSAAAPSGAQRAKALRGVVHDPLGSLVVGASVQLLQQDAVIATATTRPDGSFSFDLPLSRSYRLRVNAATFQTTIRQLNLSGSGSELIDITLATPTLTEQITVTANGLPTPEAQTGTAVTVLPADDYRYMPEVQIPLRLVPGLQITQIGQTGGLTGLFIRGGRTDANKVLIDGVPANSIGGGVNFANLATVGVNSIEVLREPNSALYGSDALAGVVSLTSTRGTTPLPLITYSGDGGNFSTYRNEVTAGTHFRQLDLYSAFARLDTSNSLPNSKFHDATYAGNFGWKPTEANDLRFTVRHVVVSGGQPNAIGLYGIPDDSQQKEQDNYYNAVWDGQTTPKWHNQIRYGGLRLHGQFNNFGPVGIPDGAGDTDGANVTVRGANGYSVSGQAIFYYGGSVPYSFLSQTKRDFVYAQTDYQVTPHLRALGAFKFEQESGISGNAGAASPSTVQRGNYSYTVQLSGDLRSRLFYTLGSGLEDNGLFGFAATPRLSLAYYLVRPNNSSVLSGTKLHGSFGKGIKEPSPYDQTNSLVNGLLSLPSAPGVPSGAEVIARYGIQQVGAENSRSFDGGVDQQFFQGRVRAGISYFHNEFTNGLEYVPPSGVLQLLGITANNPYAATINSSFGGSINSLAYRAQGIEFESEYRVSGHFFARGGYTYTDAVVQRSFASNTSGTVGPDFNTASSFPTTPIGAYSPLMGARPFRLAPHTGYFGLTYNRPRIFMSLTGTLVGRRDDSDFLTDASFGNSLLLPNRNLLGSYERLELGGGYQLTPHVNLYANVQNLLSQHYFEAFGYPSLPLTFRSGIKMNFGGETWKLK